MATNKIEKERGYFFTEENYINKISGIKTQLMQHNPIFMVSNVKDSYLNRQTRIRQYESLDGSSPDKISIDYKIGENKLKGRKESSVTISEEIANQLLPSTSLIVRRQVCYYRIESLNCEVVIEFIDSPFEIINIEIESTNDKEPIKLEELIDIDFTPKECIKNKWDYFNRRIGVCGGPSSGKTETAKWLSNLINTKYSGSTIYCSEFATDFIASQNRIPLLEDQFIIFNEQRNRELSLLEKNNIIISDSPSFMAYIYARLYADKSTINSSSLRFNLSKLYEYVLQDLESYTDIVLMQPRSIVNNGIRYNSEEEANKIFDLIKEFLEQHKINYYEHNINTKHNIINDIFELN
jgi:nicotinamide riboside kinase